MKKVIINKPLYNKPSHLTVFTYHTGEPLKDEEIKEIMDFIGVKLGKNLKVGGARRLTPQQEKSFWKHYNSKKEVQKKKTWKVLIEK